MSYDSERRLDEATGLLALIDRVRAEERERCAKIAEEADLPETATRAACRATAQSIAATIRGRT